MLERFQEENKQDGTFLFLQSYNVIGSFNSPNDDLSRLSDFKSEKNNDTLQLTRESISITLEENCIGAGLLCIFSLKH